jgi:hypothetical protein
MRGYFHMRAAVLGALVAVVLAGCGSPMTKYAGNDPAMVYVPLARAGVADGRPAFRSVFCQVLAQTPVQSQQPCDYWLRHRDDEGPAVPAPPAAAPPRRHHLLVVTGIFAECLPKVPAFGDAVERLRQLGYTVDHVAVKGRASAEWNADIIDAHVRQALAADAGRSFIVLAYSKGAVDTLTALDRHPALASHVAAVISFAGAVNGSPLADQYLPLYRRLAADIRLDDCAITDGGEMASLTRAHRLNWLATHVPPVGPRYFSIVATPSPDRVSTAFVPMYTALSHIDPRNDGQVLHSDAILPGATLLGYVNADHFAIAMPFQQLMPALARTFIDMNDFPRQQLVEAAVLFAERSLPQKPLQAE